MKNVEIYIDEILVYKNGKTEDEQKLVLAFEWEDRSFSEDDPPAAFNAKKVKNAVPITLKQAAPINLQKEVERRVFKTKIEGTSLLKVTLLRERELSKFGKLLGKIFGAVATAATGTISGVIGAAIATKGAEEIFKFKDKWKNILGEGVAAIDASNLSDGETMQLDFTLTDKVQKTLLKLYSKTDTQVGSRRPIRTPMDGIEEFLDGAGNTNGHVKLSVKTYP